MPVVMGRWMRAELVWLRSYMIGPASERYRVPLLGSANWSWVRALLGRLLSVVPHGDRPRTPESEPLIGREARQRTAGLLAGVEGDLLARGQEGSVWVDI
jgi:hypothetical protein